ncbi:C2H2-type domain-containing protein [Plasmodiophora brassicae]|uniref:Uncharacterized protein n=1 Tax=Plasmodiophora brassicae TaxID=37360 RepID=A0A0G4ITI6_PLABS|nr:hypothetical protein PBRA_006540 [Plasmodiophora brassicae]SPQ94509.1 unnamed protein product [Plasmodiophora brassicae]
MLGRVTGRWASRLPRRWGRRLASSSPSDDNVVNDEKYPIPANIEQATGRELLELQAEAQGAQAFDREPARGPFGTKEAPALIPSGKHARIVGCVGPPDDEHMPLYFELTDGPMQQCLECKQVFKLAYIGDDPDYVHAGGHH